MRRICKSCNNFKTDEQGNTYCSLLGEPRDGAAFPAHPFPDSPGVECWEKKRRASGAELSAKLREAGRKGGLLKKGKGGHGKGRKPTKQLCVNACDHEVLVRLSQSLGLSIMEALHRVCATIIEGNPQLRPDNWMDEF